MPAPRYYALVSSLPRLARFDRADFLPITHKQLESRLRTLVPEHLSQLQAAWTLLSWRNQPPERTTAAFAAQYAKVMEAITEPALGEYVEFAVGQRTVIAALRMQLGGGPPQRGVHWGAGRWTRKIASNWDDENLGMKAVFPWIGQARRLLQARDARGLEHLLSDVAWQRLSMIEGRTPFGFERVIGFVFKWELIRRWLGFDAETAKTRFQELLAEVLRDHQQIFAR